MHAFSAMPDFDTSQFIVEVKTRPAIWDSRHPLYSNKLEKQQAWYEVFAAIYLDYNKRDECEKKLIGRLLQRKWRSIRDCYVREVKLQIKEAHCTSIPLKRRPYIYYDQLTFLEPSISKKKLSSDNDDNDSDLEITTPEVTVIDDDEEIVNENKKIDETPLIDLNKNNNQNFPSPLKRKHKDISRTELNLVHRGQDSGLRQDNNNQDRMFLLSLENDLVQVPDDYKLDAKIEIMAVLKKWKQFRIDVSALQTNNN